MSSFTSFKMQATCPRPIGAHWDIPYTRGARFSIYTFTNLPIYQILGENHTISASCESKFLVVGSLTVRSTQGDG